MLKVVFWNDWLSPEPHLYRTSDPRNASGARDVPEDVAGYDETTGKAKNLPKSARIVGRTEEQRPHVGKYKNPAHEIDPQYVTDANNRKREEDEQRQRDADEAKAFNEAQEKLKLNPVEETNDQREMRELLEAQEEEKAVSRDTGKAGKKKG